MIVKLRKFLMDMIIFKLGQVLINLITVCEILGHVLSKPTLWGIAIMLGSGMLVLDSLAKFHQLGAQPEELISALNLLAIIVIASVGFLAGTMIWKTGYERRSK